MFLLLPDYVRLVPASVLPPASYPKSGQLTPLVGTVQAQAIIASLRSANHLVIRVGDTDVVMR